MRRERRGDEREIGNVSAIGCEQRGRVAFEKRRVDVAGHELRMAKDALVQVDARRHAVHDILVESAQHARSRGFTIGAERPFSYRIGRWYGFTYDKSRMVQVSLAADAPGTNEFRVMVAPWGELGDPLPYVVSVRDTTAGLP